MLKIFFLSLVAILLSPLLLPLAGLYFVYALFHRSLLFVERVIKVLKGKRKRSTFIEHYFGKV